MNLFKSMGISSEGLNAQKTYMETISLNLANFKTTRTESGGAYRRKTVRFSRESGDSGFSSMLAGRLREKSGVYATHLAHFRNLNPGPQASFPEGKAVSAAVHDDQRPFQMVFDPSHPDANGDGYVNFPNINVFEEMVNMTKAVRGYEANITAFNAAKSMALKALEIGR